MCVFARLYSRFPGAGRPTSEFAEQKEKKVKEIKRDKKRKKKVKISITKKVNCRARRRE